MDTPKHITQHDLTKKEVQNKLHALSCAPKRTFSKEMLDASVLDVSQKLEALDAVLIAHYYAPSITQTLAERTGGLVGDSLEMAKFGAQSTKKRIIVAGVRFMAESAKILSPEKEVYILDQESECSLDLLCPVDDFRAWRHAHPDWTAVVYANTSAAVKAQSDWVITSSVARAVVQHLADKGEKILFAPDQHLGRYIQKETGATMKIWSGSCVVHEEFQASQALLLKKRHPQSALMAHPESPESVLDHADFVGSTSQIIHAAKTMEAPTLIVATDEGIFYKLQESVPQKQLLLAPTRGATGDCQSCGRCPWMQLNTFESLKSLLEEIESGTKTQRQIELDGHTIECAKKPLMRLLNFQR